MHFNLGQQYMARFRWKSLGGGTEEDIVAHGSEKFSDETNVFQFLPMYIRRSKQPHGGRTDHGKGILSGRYCTGVQWEPVSGRQQQSGRAAVRAAVILPVVVPAFPAEGRG